MNWFVDSPPPFCGSKISIQEIVPSMTLAHSSRLTEVLVSLFAIVFVFVSLASAEGKEKVLHSFQGGTNDGEYPAGGVVFDKAGNLYGATTDGGGECPPAQCGTVFQLAPPAQKGDPWTETVLYIFKGNGSGDGNTPAGSVITDGAGHLYGTTGYGGTGNCVLLSTKVGCGTVYELSPPPQKGGAWTETVLYSFPTPKQGYVPNGNLVFDSSGNLYGATTFGGGYGTSCDPYYQYCGAVFELSPPKHKGSKWTEKVLHGFAGMESGSLIGDGANPNGGLVVDSKGAIYGTTYTGGFRCPHDSGQGCGSVFNLAPPAKKGGSWTETLVHSFHRDASDGGYPQAGLVIDKTGRMCGTTLNGGPGGYGTAFCLTPPPEKPGSWNETILYGFKDNNQYGADPAGGLTLGSHGNFYGTTNAFGAHFGGAVFELKPKGANWEISLLYSFTGPPDGEFPAAGLIFDGSGNLYGTSQAGGNAQSCQSGCGTVFEVSP
jgi:hypothetical protein